MLKEFTFLALVLIGSALLILGRGDTNGFGRTPNIVWVAEHPHACLAPCSERQRLPRTRLQPINVSFEDPAMIPASVATSVQQWRCRAAQLQARLRASFAKLHAQTDCWVNSCLRKPYCKPTPTSQAWRDMQYDAQVLARVLGLCKQEPV